MEFEWDYIIGVAGFMVQRQSEEKMKYVLFLLILLLAACDHNTVGVPTDRVIVTNQCIQREIFKECLATVPAGPLATKYNDWDEVVAECRHSAHYMSQRPRGTIIEECRGN